MEFMPAVKKCMRDWITFSGRAPRSEYWWFTLFNVIVSFVAQLGLVALGAVLSQAGGFGSIIMAVISIAALVFLVFLAIAGISAVVRRLHDKDKSGWWYWIALVPIVGVILLLVWFCQRGTVGPNRFGEDPLGGVSEQVFE